MVIVFLHSADGSEPKRFQLGAEETHQKIRIGRHKKLEVFVSLPWVSWNHAELRLQEGTEAGNEMLIARDSSSHGTGLRKDGSPFGLLKKGEDVPLHDGSILVVPMSGNVRAETKLEELCSVFMVQIGGEEPRQWNPADDLAAAAVALGLDKVKGKPAEAKVITPPVVSIPVASSIAEAKVITPPVVSIPVASIIAEAKVNTPPVVSIPVASSIAEDKVITPPVVSISIASSIAEAKVITPPVVSTPVVSSIAEAKVITPPVVSTPVVSTGIDAVVQKHAATMEVNGIAGSTTAVEGKGLLPASKDIETIEDLEDLEVEILDEKKPADNMLQASECKASIAHAANGKPSSKPEEPELADDMLTAIIEGKLDVRHVRKEPELPDDMLAEDMLTAIIEGKLDIKNVRKDEKKDDKRKRSRSRKRRGHNSSSKSRKRSRSRRKRRGRSDSSKSRKRSRSRSRKKKKDKDSKRKEDKKAANVVRVSPSPEHPTDAPLKKARLDRWRREGVTVADSAPLGRPTGAPPAARPLGPPADVPMGPPGPSTTKVELNPMAATIPQGGLLPNPLQPPMGQSMAPSAPSEALAPPSMQPSATALAGVDQQIVDAVNNAAEQIAVLRTTPQSETAASFCAALRPRSMAIGAARPVGVAQESKWPEPFWKGGRGRTLLWQDPVSGSIVRFQASVIRPSQTPAEAAAALRGDAPPVQDGKLPLVVYFSGVGSSGGLEEMKLGEMAFTATGPFVLVAPMYNRPYWCLSQGGDWGFVDGAFLESEVKLVAAWINHLSASDLIDEDWISILGFSAGAYAATELLSCHDLRLRCVILGGTHGHGQPDDKDLGGRRKQMYDQPGGALMKWKEYMRRLSQHSGATGGILMVHHTGDNICDYGYAKMIFEQLERRQGELGLVRAIFEDVPPEGIEKKKKSKSVHKYHDYSFIREEVLSRLVPVAMAAPVGSICAAADKARRIADFEKADAQFLKARYVPPRGSVEAAFAKRLP